MGMFNRETLCLRASQIDSDLRYFGIVELNNGDIVLGKFLFGHYTKCKVEILDQTYERYAYEFMHDTFCEFLIARHIVYLLQHLDASNPSIEYHSAKLMDDRLILSLSGSLVGDQNPRVLESITQLNINVKSQYWFNVILWKMQNRDKYNQDTREALKSFREACLKEKQHQYLCTYYMIFQKILVNNGIIYLHNSNSRKTAKNIVEDQQFLKDGTSKDILRKILCNLVEIFVLIQ